jgi:hypothetical protein
MGLDMKPRHSALLLLLLACASTMPAQTPCPPGDISQRTGAWQRRPFPKAAGTYRAAPGSYDRAAADRTLDTILALFRAAYPQPTGTNAYFDRDLTFSTPSRGVPFGYALSLAFSGFYCTSAGRLAEYGESGVFVNVEVNRFESAGLLVAASAPSMSTSAGQHRFNPADGEDTQYTIGGRRIFLMPTTSGTHRGADYYAKHEYATDRDPPDWQWFVIRKPDVPLLLPVTRREYVQQFRSELQDYTEREIANRLEWARQSGDNTVVAQVPVFARGQAAYLQAVDDYLARADAAELARPVSAPLMFLARDPDNPAVQFRDGARIMATLNPAYLDTRVPAHVPRFIVIQLSARATRHPYEANLRERIAAGLDIDALKALLGR